MPRNPAYRTKLGELMQHWHSSMNDPIYAVGSFYFSGQRYPARDVVVSARDAIQALIPSARRREHGWTLDDVVELQTIEAGLMHFLQEDYAS